MSSRSKKRGRIFIISAPSGCGKTTLKERLLESKLGLVPSVSVTTRPKRKGEEEGTEYHFVDYREFNLMKKNGGFLEWVRTFGWFYGTPRGFVEKNLTQGMDVLLTVDVKGALKVKSVYPDSVLIFVLPPSMSALRERLRLRKAEGNKEIQKRLRLARREIALSKRYDYTVVNDDIKSAVEKLKSIIIAERCRVLTRG